MRIRTKRVYDTIGSGDGFRILVDRLWPRGVSKDSIEMDMWAKDLAPSAELRKAFHGTGRDFVEFRGAYLAELGHSRDALDDVLAAMRSAGKRNLTLLYASRENIENHAAVLRDHILTIIPNATPGD